jgi:hypothetical protein
VCAAVAAARAGLPTVLLEKRGTPGGTVTAGFHRHLCGLFANDRKRPFSPLNGGLAEEITGRLDARSGRDSRTVMGRVEVYAFRRRDLLEIMKGLMDSEDILDARMDSEVVSVETGDGGVTRLDARTPEGNISLRPGAVIDASGDGTVLRLCGAVRDRPPDPERQLAGYSVVLGGVDAGDDTLEVKVPYRIREAVTDGELPDCLRFTTYSPGASPSRGVCRLSVPAGTEADKAERYGQKVHAILAGRIEALSRSRVEDRSPCVLERDGDLLDGEYVLSEDDVFGEGRFPDAAARAAWPIEFWHRDRGPEYRYLEEGRHYEIPVRCLRSHSIRNLFAAGRCISADGAAQASARVSGTCMALGEAAAKAAIALLRGEGS